MEDFVSLELGIRLHLPPRTLSLDAFLYGSSSHPSLFISSNLTFSRNYSTDHFSIFKNKSQIESGNFKSFAYDVLIDRLFNHFQAYGTTNHKLVVSKSHFDILKIHSRKMNLMRGINLKKISKKMDGAQLKAACTETGRFALRERRVHVTQEDFEMAVAKVMKKDTEKNMSLRKLWK